MFKIQINCLLPYIGFINKIYIGYIISNTINLTL